MTEKTALTPSTHTTPPAKFSHGVRKGNILQVAGQVGFLPAVEGQAPTPAGDLEDVPLPHAVRELRGRRGVGGGG
ncbi:hypothetical protein PV370_30685, partial [Streptomyces sp. NE06-03C]|nr:hypothetical protein [Streptomyces sp. NE06-03C]